MAAIFAIEMARVSAASLPLPVAVGANRSKDFVACLGAKVCDSLNIEILIGLLLDAPACQANSLSSFYPQRERTLRPSNAE